MRTVLQNFILDLPWLLVVGVGLANTSCATKALHVSSLPAGAEVQIMTKDHNLIKAGKTPLDLDGNNAPSLFEDSVQVQIVREGFQTQNILVPKMDMGGVGRIHVNMDETALPKVCQSQQDSFNDMAKGIAEATNLIQRKSYPEASIRLQQLIAKYPNVPVLYDLQGNAYYLQHDVTRAIEAYRRSNALSPDNSSTTRMIQRLQQLQGPQSGGM